MLYEVITVRKLTSFEQVAEIQDFYRDFGLDFAKAKDILEMAIRITSYNVCYTKLLRLFCYFVLFG